MNHGAGDFRRLRQPLPEAQEALELFPGRLHPENRFRNPNTPKTGSDTPKTGSEIRNANPENPQSEIRNANPENQNPEPQIPHPELRHLDLENYAY